MEETLGKRIAYHRKRLGMTQDSLAELLGVTAQAVSKWENDQSCPDISMLPKLSEVFDISTDELLGIQRKEVHIEEVISDEQKDAGPENGNSAQVSRKWEVLTTPGAAFALWLLLTGLVGVIEVLKGISVSFWDVAISSGILVFGLVGFFHSFSILRLGCAIGGTLFLLELVFGTDYYGIMMDWTLPFAIGLALLGLDLLINAIRKPNQKGFIMDDIGHMVRGSTKNHCTYDGETFDCVTCFGSGDRQIQLPRLSGGHSQVTFGELFLDLSRCGEIADDCEISLECAFGSLEIQIPRKYRVEAASSTAFGAVETKGIPDPDAEITIYLKCKVSFGEISIRHI